MRDLSPEEEDVRLGSVHHVVDPAGRLLHAQVAPLRLGHQVSLGHQLRNVWGQHHVSGHHNLIEKKETDFKKKIIL